MVPQCPGVRVKLPGNAIGISDSLDYRECPARMEFGMRRHMELPDGSKDEPPEHRNWTNAYGSAIHDAISYVEREELTNAQAIEKAWAEWGPYLDEEDLALLSQDLDKYRRDTPLGWRLVAAEEDVRVPLFWHEGVQYFFRFRLDALYQLIANPSVFYHRDYKSSKWPKTDAEVHKDPQMSAYSWGIYEMWPECERLIQSYEQLRHGNVITTRSAEQREQSKAWLIETVKAIVSDDEMKPKQNDFCPYCPLVMTCSVTERSTVYWRGTLAVLAPLTKEGRRLKVELADDAEEVERLMTDTLPRAIRARKHLEHFEKELKSRIEKMPSNERARLGWKTTERKTRMVPPEGLARIHEAVGDVFYNLVTISKRSVELFVGKPKKGIPLTPELKSIRDEELEIVTTGSIVREDEPPE